MQFCWHARAQAFDARGQEFGPGPSAGGVLPDLPAAAALQAALGSATFRIGATTAPPPEPGAQPVFETLTGGTSGAPRRIRRTQERERHSIESKAGEAVRDIHGLRITSSFGVASVKLGAKDAPELIDQADNALYESKKSGRNRVSVWSGARSVGAEAEAEA